MPRGAVRRNTKEIEYGTVASYSIVGLVYVLLILPYLTNSLWFVTLNPVAAYLIWNLGYLFIFVGIFGAIIGFLGANTDLFGMIRSGIAGFLIFSWVFDIIQPPLTWSTSGQLLIPPGQSLENTAVDYMFGELFKGIGVSGFPLFVMVYGLIPIVGIVLAFLLLNPAQFLDAAGINSRQ